MTLLALTQKLEALVAEGHGQKWILLRIGLDDYLVDVANIIDVVDDKVVLYTDITVKVPL